MEMVKVAFMAGSSRQGKASRAEVGSNCVTPNHLKISCVFLFKICTHIFI